MTTRRLLPLLLAFGCARPAPSLPTPQALLGVEFRLEGVRAIVPSDSFRVWFYELNYCTGNADDFGRIHWWTAEAMAHGDTLLLGVHKYFAYDNRLHSMILLRNRLPWPLLRRVVLHELVHRLYPFALHGGKRFHDCIDDEGGND